MRFTIAVLLATISTHVCSANRGFNTSQPFTPEIADCMQSNGYVFFISRLMTDGIVDEIGLQNVQNAKAAFPSNVYGSASPCVTDNCPSAFDQVDDLLNRVDSVPDFVWLGFYFIEVLGNNWSQDIARNREFLQELFNEFQSRFRQPGIYTNAESWARIMGNSTDYANYWLWWDNPNGVADTTTDFQPFGGWTQVACHHYSKNDQVCGIAVDGLFR